MPRAVAIASGTASGSPTGASSTSHTPSGNSSASSAPTARASRVLPDAADAAQGHQLAGSGPAPRPRAATPARPTRSWSDARQVAAAVPPGSRRQSGIDAACVGAGSAHATREGPRPMDHLTLLTHAREHELSRGDPRSSTTRRWTLVTNCPPWTVRRLASHALKNQLFWAGSVTGQRPHAAGRGDGRGALRGRPGARSPPRSPRGCWSCGAPTG